jgi:uncharacterized integral membrane protein
VKRLSWIWTLPLMVVAVIFAIANRESVMLDLWPLEISIQAPLFILVLGSVAVGLFAGGVAVWFSGGHTRRQARAARRQVAELERELANLRHAYDKVPPAPVPGTAVAHAPSVSAASSPHGPTAAGGGQRMAV